MSLSPGTLVLRTGGACQLDPEHLLEVFGWQRRRFVAILRGFGPEDWAAPTRCAEWSAHDVVRHLCDITAIAADADERAVDLKAGFDPRTTPWQWLSPSAGESPGATLGRLVATTEKLIGAASERLARGHRFDVRLPYGPMDWTIQTLHAFWDSWIHERDVLLPRGTEHPTDGDATRYAAAYGVFIAAAVAAMFGDPVRGRLTLGGDGGGVFDVDSGEEIILTVSQADTAGLPTVQVTDALAGRPPDADVLGELPADAAAALSHLAAYFNTPAEPGPAR